MSLLSGPELCGFYGIFEASFGAPESDADDAVITPSSVGNALLPFRCPHCAGVPQALACPQTRDHYQDKRPGRKNHFCPLCGYRFRINLQGTPLSTDIRKGAVVGPSKVERTRNGKRETTWQDRPSILGHVLGTIFGMIYSPAVNYRILGGIAK